DDVRATRARLAQSFATVAGDVHVEAARLEILRIQLLCLDAVVGNQDQRHADARRPPRHARIVGIRTTACRDVKRFSRSGVYGTGTTMGAPLSLTIKTTNFAGCELLAFFETA